MPSYAKLITRPSGCTIVFGFRLIGLFGGWNRFGFVRARLSGPPGSTSARLARRMFPIASHEYSAWPHNGEGCAGVSAFVFAVSRRLSSS